MSVTVGKWYVVPEHPASEWRYGNTPLKVLKITPHTITIGYNGINISDISEEDDEITIEYIPKLYKLHHTHRGDLFNVKATEYSMSSSVILSNMYGFDIINDICVMNEFYEAIMRKEYYHFNRNTTFNKTLWIQAYNTYPSTQKRKVIREETIRVLVKKTNLPVEIKKLITEWL
jgi:hypothetical protein